jgi:hypothetical protein
MNTEQGVSERALGRGVMPTLHKILILKFSQRMILLPCLHKGGELLNSEYSESSSKSRVSVVALRGVIVYSSSDTISWFANDFLADFTL